MGGRKFHVELHILDEKQDDLSWREKRKSFGENYKRLSSFGEFLS